MFNTLQLNNGNGSFSEIGQVAGISKTDWSWSVLMADFDNDGYKDMSISNGTKKDLRNNDYLQNLRKTAKESGGQIIPVEWIDKVPSNPLPNYMFRNNGDYTFSKVAKEWGMNQPGFSNGSAYADLDLDGDLDLVFNNIDAPASIYENRRGRANNFIRFKFKDNKGNPFGLNTKVVLHCGSKKQMQELTLTRGYLSSSEPVLHFGLGKTDKVDKVEITWPDGPT